MATAVLDIELSTLPRTFPVSARYAEALLLLRMHGRPVGAVRMPVIQNQVHLPVNFIDTLSPGIRYAIGEKALHHKLGFDERKIPEYRPPRATVAVCTRDRTEDLKKCLDALVKLPDRGQEIIVVDNAPSTPDTKNLVAEYPGVRYVLEEKKGLNNARNRAMEEASHEVVAFTDDDAVPEPDWLDHLLQNFGQPQVMAVTGLTMPLELETPAQEMFEKYSPFNKGFNRRVFSAASMNPLATGRVGAGANMALRKKLLQLVGPFDPALDAGTATQSGGDHEYFACILAHGYKIVYDPSALSWHRHRRTWPELVQTIHGYGVGVYALLTRHLIKNGEWSVLKVAWLWLIKDQLPNLVRSMLKRPGAYPLQLIWAELTGCLRGPFAYLSATRKRVSANPKKEVYAAAAAG